MSTNTLDFSTRNQILVRGYRFAWKNEKLSFFWVWKHEKILKMWSECDVKIMEHDDLVWRQASERWKLWSLTQPPLDSMNIWLLYFTDAKKKLRLVLSTPTLSLYAGNRIPEMSGRWIITVCFHPSPIHAFFPARNHTHYRQEEQCGRVM